MNQGFTPSQLEKLTKARCTLHEMGVFYEHLCRKAVFASSSKVKTSGVNSKMQIFFNPEWLDNPATDPAEVAWRIVHDLHHVIRNHTLDAELAASMFKNANGDPAPLELVRLGQCLAIDCHLESFRGFPRGALTPSKLGYANYQLAGEYVQLLIDRCGNGPPLHNPHGCSIEPLDDLGDIDLPSRDLVEIREAIKAAAQQAQADTRGSHRGSGGGFWHEILLKLEDPPERVPFERVLFGLVQRVVGEVTSGASDYSYARPPRMNSGASVIPPRLVGAEVQVHVILDTSGSMALTDYAIVAKTVTEMLRSLGVHAYRLTEVDTGVRSTKIMHQPVFPSSLHGGGGSDITDAILLAERIRPKTNLNIVLTDGDIITRAIPTVPTVVVVTRGNEGEREKSLAQVHPSIRDIGPILFTEKIVFQRDENGKFIDPDVYAAFDA